MTEAPTPAFAEDLHDLYENAPFAYLSMRLDGRLLKVNTTLARWTGYAPEHFVGKRLHDVLTVATGILYETSVAPLIAMHGAFSEASLDLRTAANGALPVFGSGMVREDESGNPASVRISFVRAAERRLYERRLVAAHERSQGAERVAQGLLDSERETSVLREQFIAVLGHDLRNPLASISGGLRLLGKDPPEDRRKLLLELLEASTLRMSGLIDNVMDFARGRLGSGIPLNFRPDVLLAPVLEQVVAELRLGSPDRVIETDFDLPASIKCDPSRISQLVSNMLGNALTHGAGGGPVRLHAGADTRALTIWIANGGQPIAADVIPDLFKPFFRGDIRSNQQGLGLGLYIASEIARAHGGTLTVTSDADETRFTLTMPIGTG